MSLYLNRHFTIMHRLSIVIILIIIILTGCTKEFDSTLLKLNEQLNTDPELALDRIDSIDYTRLSPHDRHYFDFLTIKANDKTYHLHTSDSLILDVINYMSKKGSKAQYAEVLYYGGRVYKDLGDHPNAIHYFQRALDELPDNTDLNLKANILSQTGRLFNELRLNDEATYYLEQVIEIDKQLNDTMNLVYDLQLLGHINLNISNLSTAEKLFKEALDCSSELPVGYSSKSRMYLAETKRRLGNIDSALFYIKNIISDIPQGSQNTALAMTAKVYHDAGRYDSAYFYAKKLVNSNNRINKKTGYEIILSPQIIAYNTPDEINQYIDEYRHTIEHIFDDNKNRLAIGQITQHNYESQQRLRIKAERSEALFKYISLGASFIIVALISFVLFLLHQRKKSKHLLFNVNKELRHNISTINKLKQQLNNNSETGTQMESESIDDLRKRILLLYETNQNNIPSLPDNLINSDIYHLILTHLRQENPINNNDSLWESLKELINSTFPTFKPTLVKLSAGKLTEEEFRTTLLIKIGIQTSDIAKLLAKSKGSIISRRHSLSFKMFGKKLGTQATDTIIKLL